MGTRTLMYWYATAIFSGVHQSGLIGASDRELLLHSCRSCRGILMR